MYGLVIVNQTIGHNDYKINRLVPEFLSLGVKLDIFVNNGTLAKIEGENIVVNLPKADFVIYLDKDIYLARILEKCGYRLFNNADFLKLCDDKMLTLINTSNGGIKMIKTIAAPLVYTDKLTNENMRFLDYVMQELSFPLIVKKVYGSLGEGIYLANTKEELFDLYKRFFREPLIFEEYISTSKGRSVRALVIDNKCIGVIERYNDTDFRSNFGKQNHSRKIEKDKIYKDFAEKIAKLLNIEYAGIDFLYLENDEPILCEINSNAFFEEFEKTTNINVANLYAKMVVRKIKNNE